LGRLYVVATPIGNLGDITIRALETLRSCDLILAEDTRRTRALLARYDITTPLKSYHQHNKRRLDDVLSRLDAADVALVSDAGMPAVSDPGFELITVAVEKGIEVDVIPGPSAVVTAVVGAALPAPGFLFAGFLPRGDRDRVKRLESLAGLPYALVFYEAPHRLRATVDDMIAVLGNRAAVAARELTKVHQEYVRGTLASLAERYTSQEPRGEFTLVVAGATAREEDRADEAREAMRVLRERGESARDAVDAVMARFGMTRNDAYKLWVETSHK